MPETATTTVEKRVLIDLDRCIECGSCSAACYYSHANMPAVGFARSGWALLPLICRQCKAASCVEACPAEAMVRDDAGVVRRRLFRCIGCGSCARACPFGVIPNELGGTPTAYRSPDRLNGHQVAKCDLCADRTARGKGDRLLLCEAPSGPSRQKVPVPFSTAVPRCVAACPSGALVYADEHHAREERLEVLGGRTTGEDPFKRR